jgi:hypothetical protein
MKPIVNIPRKTPTEIILARGDSRSFTTTAQTTNNDATTSKTTKTKAKT